MLRFIIERHEADYNNNINRKDISTIEADVPELELLLKQGGTGPMGFESYQLIGVEEIIT